MLKARMGEIQRLADALITALDSAELAELAEAVA